MEGDLSGGMIPYQWQRGSAVAPALSDHEKLAAWLEISLQERLWFADLKGLSQRTAEPKLTHYNYRVIEKRPGADRLIEMPKTRLKLIQHQILREILDKLPGHPSVHGFRRGRSILSFAAPHVAQDVVLRMDFENFFPSITLYRVRGLFRALGFADSIADLLAGLCTNAAPVGDVVYRRRHLPQGAPTSPSLANLCAYHLDCRLTGLAATSGLHFTRYADDLAFSGPSIPRAFPGLVRAIAAEERFTVNERKTHLMKQGVRQSLAGLVVNEICNVRRTDFDELKAILHNCRSHGPDSQNHGGHPSFREHLLGRIGFVESVNPAKGAKLRVMMGAIDWA